MISHSTSRVVKQHCCGKRGKNSFRVSWLERTAPLAAQSWAELGMAHPARQEGNLQILQENAVETQNSDVQSMARHKHDFQPRITHCFPICWTLETLPCTKTQAICTVAAKG